LRLEDNIGLFHALESKYPVIPLFIFDDSILDSLPETMQELDSSMNHYHYINEQLKQIGSSLLVKKKEKLLRMEIAYSEFDIKKCSLIKIEQYAIKG
jgi:deoxyribodipyrimidine photo-lyase